MTSAIKETFQLKWSFLHNKIAIVEEETKEQCIAFQYIIENECNLEITKNESSNGPKWSLKKILDEDKTEELFGVQKTYLSKHCKNPILD